MAVAAVIADMGYTKGRILKGAIGDGAGSF